MKMKNLKTQFITVLLVVSILIPACVENETSKFSSKKFLKSYKNSEYVISFSLPPALLRLFIDRDEKELRELLKQIDDMQFLIFEDDYFTGTSSKELFAEIDKELIAHNFQDLIIIKESNEQVKFKIRENENKVKDLIMLVAGNNEMVIMNISGNINLSDIELITDNIDVHKVKNYH